MNNPTDYATLIRMTDQDVRAQLNRGENADYVRIPRAVADRWEQTHTQGVYIARQHYDAGSQFLEVVAARRICQYLLVADAGEGWAGWTFRVIRQVMERRYRLTYGPPRRERQLFPEPARPTTTRRLRMNSLPPPESTVVEWATALSQRAAALEQLALSQPATPPPPASPSINAPSPPFSPTIRAPSPPPPVYTPSNSPTERASSHESDVTDEWDEYDELATFRGDDLAGHEDLSAEPLLADKTADALGVQRGVFSRSGMGNTLRYSSHGADWQELVRVAREMGIPNPEAMLLEQVQLFEDVEMARETSDELPSRESIGETEDGGRVDARTAGLQVLPATLEDGTNMKVDPTSKKTLLGERRLVDAQSWVISLNTSGITVSSPHPNYLIDYAAFKVLGFNDSEPSYFNHYVIVTTSSASCRYDISTFLTMILRRLNFTSEIAQ
jgi:hypothetical protein